MRLKNLIFTTNPMTNSILMGNRLYREVEGGGLLSPSVIFFLKTQTD